MSCKDVHPHLDTPSLIPRTVQIQVILKNRSADGLSGEKHSFAWVDHCLCGKVVTGAGHESLIETRPFTFIY